MKISQIMHTNPVCINMNESLSNIAKEMKKGDFGAVIVKDGDKPVGVITDRDIVVRALVNADKIADIKAKDVMTKKIFSCNANDSVENASQKMKSEQIRRLIVLDDQNKMIGIISLGDMAVSEKTNESSPVFEALKGISKHH